MPDKPVALVTGANQGIGLQIAKDLVGHGFTVLVLRRSILTEKVSRRGFLLSLFNLGVRIRIRRIDVLLHVRRLREVRRVRSFGAD